MISKNRRQLERDLQELDPKDRVMMLERLMQYVIPKKQAVKPDLSDLTENDVTEVADMILTKIRNDEH